MVEDLILELPFCYQIFENELTWYWKLNISIAHYPNSTNMLRRVVKKSVSKGFNYLQILLAGNISPSCLMSPSCGICSVNVTPSLFPLFIQTVPGMMQCPLWLATLKIIIEPTLFISNFFSSWEWVCVFSVVNFNWSGFLDVRRPAQIQHCSTKETMFPCVISASNRWYSSFLFFCFVILLKLF